MARSSRRANTVIAKGEGMLSEGWAKLRGRRQRRHRRTTRSALHEFPRLYDRRLERRRLLSGSPIAEATPLPDLVLDAGQGAGDGASDTFRISIGDAQSPTALVASVNGQVVFQGSLDDIGSIRIAGSTDVDR